MRIRITGTPRNRANQELPYWVRKSLVGLRVPAEKTEGCRPEICDFKIRKEDLIAQLRSLHDDRSVSVLQGSSLTHVHVMSKFCVEEEDE